jgi:hypothetical protein
MSRLSIPHRANKSVWLLEDFAELSRVNLPRADYLAEESPGLALICVADRRKFVAEHASA